MGAKKKVMATIQTTVWAWPMPAAMPTQALPTTESSWAKTRSRRVSWRWRWCVAAWSGSSLGVESGWVVWEGSVIVRDLP
jgi:hypothetical protein